MKTTLKLLILPIISLIMINSAFGESDQEKARKAYERMFNAAHPKPMEKPKFDFNVPLSNEQGNSIFINVNTIVDDEPRNQKMQNESSIAVNPVNPLNLIASAVDYRDTSASWIYISRDGGRSWMNKKLGRPFPGWRSSNDPSVAFDPDGVGYLVYGAHGVSGGSSIGENGVYLSKTYDQGETWQTHIPVILHKGNQTLDSTFEDKYYITVDMSPESDYYNHLYIPWKRVIAADSSTQIVISKSLDKGDNWTIPVNVSEYLPGSSEDTTFGQSFPLCACGPKGELYVVWNHGIEHGVGFAKSMDGGDNFSDPEIIHHYNIFGEANNISGDPDNPIYRHTVKGKVRAEAYPVIKTDISHPERKGWVYLSWAADNPPNVYFSKSMDKGESWSEPLIVHSVETNDQFWQWMDVDPLTGDLAIMYFDSRNDPENIMVECWVSYSSDGGDTWTDRQAADISGDLRLNPFQGNSFAGDYSGAAFYDGNVYPSWIDMRSAVTDIFDSDVYTALVNVRQPLPPVDFAAEILADEPENIILHWTEPTERAFGQELAPDDFKYVLFRNGEFAAEIPSGTTEYKDEALTAYEKYEYELFAVADADSSRPADLEAYPGGSKQPGMPEIISLQSSENNTVTLHVKLPSLRKDNITELINLAGLRIYDNEELVEELTVEAALAGQIAEFEIEFPERGFYNLSLSAIDSNNPANESDPTESRLVYTGPVEKTFSESFDEKSLKRYYNPDNWGQTGDFYHSVPYSLTETPDGDYKIYESYEFTLFPIEFDGTADLSFWHAAIVQSRDTAGVYFSTDAMNSWTLAAVYNSSNYEPWQDKTLDNQDWKLETLSIPAQTGDTVYIKFRLSSNYFKADDGWYIDDIGVDNETSVSENTGSGDLLVYPNPADLLINISVSGSLYSATIYDNLGRVMLELKDPAETIDISRLSSGMYVLKALMREGSTKSAVFFVR